MATLSSSAPSQLRGLTRGRKSRRRCSHREEKREDCAAVPTFSNLGAAAVGLHDLGHDGESESRAVRRRPFASPEPLEDPFAMLWRHAWTEVADLDAPIGNSR